MSTTRDEVGGLNPALPGRMEIKLIPAELLGEPRPCTAGSPGEAELVAVKDIDPRMSELDDWKLLPALHHDERPRDGLTTTDMGMTRLPPRELAVLRDVSSLSQLCKAGRHH